MSTYTNTHTNRTDRFQLVGNCKTVISDHETDAAAWKALHSLGYIDDTEWSTLHVVAPGVTVTGSFQEPDTEIRKAAGDVFGVL